MNPELSEILKIAASAIIAWFIGRASKQTDSVDDHKVRIAVQAEQITAMMTRIGILERNEKTQWAMIDKVIGARREQNHS